MFLNLNMSYVMRNAWSSLGKAHNYPAHDSDCLNSKVKTTVLHWRLLTKEVFSPNLSCLLESPYTSKLRHRSLFCLGFVLLLLLFVRREFSLCSSCWTRTHYVAQAVLQLAMFLLQYPKCLNYRYVPPCPARDSIFFSEPPMGIIT